MFKNMLKRSWLSVKRKPSRSIILGLILFAMGSLILSTIIIKSAVNESMEYAKESLGGTVAIQADMETIRGNFNSQEPPAMPDETTKRDFKRPSVSKDVADDIATSEYVKDYTYNISAFANANNLIAVETGMPTFGGKYGGMGRPGDENFKTGDFTISGINAYAFISEVKNNTMSITEGNYFDEDSTDSVIVSVDFAETNSLSVGSEIEFINIYTEEVIKLKVIGIYDITEDSFGVNAIYANVDTAAKFLSADDYNDGAYSVENVTYTMNNAENVEAFIAEINTNHPELAENNLVAKEDTSAYDQMVGPIESVGSFATTILIVVIIASIIIITLIITINVKDRRYEMGVLLSLGAKKWNIIGQTFTEIAMIAIVAFASASLVSTFLAKSMGQGILDSQLASAETEQANNFGRPTTGGRGMQRDMGGAGGNPGAPTNIPSGNAPKNSPLARRNDNTIKEIDINAKPLDFALLFISGYAIILIALLIPSINILRYEPKQILEGKD